MGYRKFRLGLHKKNEERKEQLSVQKKLPGRPRNLKKRNLLLQLIQNKLHCYNNYIEWFTFPKASTTSFIAMDAILNFAIYHHQFTTKLQDRN